MVAYVHIQYSTYQFQKNRRGVKYTLPRSLRYRKKRGSKRVNSVYLFVNNNEDPNREMLLLMHPKIKSCPRRDQHNFKLKNKNKKKNIKSTKNKKDKKHGARRITTKIESRKSSQSSLSVKYT